MKSNLIKAVACANLEEREYKQYCAFNGISIKQAKLETRWNNRVSELLKISQ